MAEQSSSQTIGGGPIPSPSLQVRLIDFATAKSFIEKWHYSHNMPSGKNICFGGFVGDDLYVVASYGHGANMNPKWYAFLNKLADLPKKTIAHENLVELKRMCRIEPPQAAYPLTKFLALCHRILRKQFGIRFVISFSDPKHNKFKTITQTKNGAVRPYISGGIYKAANFQYLGQTNAEMHVRDDNPLSDTFGEIIHRRVAYKQMWRENLLHCVKNGVSEKELRAGWKDAKNRKKWAAWAVTLPQVRKKLGYTPVKTEAKDRWLLDLGAQK